MLALVEFVREGEHGDVQLELQQVPELVEPVEAFRVAAAEPDRDHVAVRHPALGDEGLLPGEVLHDAVDRPGAQAGRVDDDLAVGIERVVDHPDEFGALAAHLVHGKGILGDGLDGHQEVVGRDDDIPVVFAAHRADEAHRIDAAQRMVAGESEPA